MNKLILAAAAVATVSVTAGCQRTTVVRTVHEPTTVVDTRTVIHDHTNVRVYEDRAPRRVEEVRVIKPAPVYVPGRRVEVYHDRAPVRPVPPAHSNSRIIREYEDHRPLPRHERERVEDKHWIRQTPIATPARPDKRPLLQQVIRPVPRAVPPQQARDMDPRQERRNPGFVPPRNVKRPPVQPVIRPVPRAVPSQPVRQQEVRQERRNPVVVPPRNVMRQPESRPVPRAVPSHPVRQQEVRQERRAQPAPVARNNSRPSNGQQNHGSQRDNRNANDHRRAEDDDQHPSANASERGKERSANNRRY